MNTKRQILWDHYTGVLRKAASWAGLLALMSTTLVAGPVNAGQVTSRSATLSDSASNASSVSYDILFTQPTTTAANAVKGVRFQFCANSPLYNDGGGCTALGGTFVRGTTITTQTDNGGALANNYTAATSGTTDVLLTNATGNTFTAAHVMRFKLSGFTNITTATFQEYYVRVVTCNDTTCTVGAGSNLDNGGYAVDVVQKISVTATVQEDLTFCVAVTVTTPCSSISGSTVTLAPNPMTTAGLSKGTAQMAASTNASGGYVITYNGSTFTDTTADTIAAAGGTVAAVNGGTEQFGFTLRAQTSGVLNTFGTNPVQGTGGVGAAASPYDTLNSNIAYTPSTGTTVANTAGAPSGYTTFTMLYVANVATTTKPGIYTATQTFIATGTF